MLTNEDTNAARAVTRLLSTGRLGLRGDLTLSSYEGSLLELAFDMFDRRCG